MWKQLVLIAVLAFAVIKIVNFVEWLGVFRRTYSHWPGKCRRLEGIEHGAEDVQLLPNGLAIISSGCMLRETEVYTSRKGRLYLFDFNNPDIAPQELTIKAGKDFQLVSPLSLSMWIDPKTDQIYLYVGKYTHAEMAVDKFSFDAESRTLTHLRRFGPDPNFRMLDNMVVVSEDNFFFTNWIHVAESLEILLGLRWGSLGFYDGTKSTIVEAGLYTPNGLALSPDGKFLYVACSAAEEILVFRRHLNNSIELHNTLKVQTVPDNLFVDLPTGDLWFTGEPVLYRGLQHLDDPVNVRVPSQVMRIKMSADGKAVDMEEIYSDDGTQLSMSSVAVVHGSTRGLLIGSVASHAVYCKIRDDDSV